MHLQDDHLGNIAVLYTTKCSQRHIPPNGVVTGRLEHGSESLREIDLSDVAVDSSFEIVFDLLQMITEVRTLRLSRCAITDRHVRVLVTKLARNRCVRKIYLDGNFSIGASSVPYLLELIGSKKSLIHLDVAGTGIPRESMSRIRLAVQLNARTSHNDSDDEEDFDVRKFAGTISHLPSTASRLQNALIGEAAERRASLCPPSPSPSTASRQVQLKQQNTVIETTSLRWVSPALDVLDRTLTVCSWKDPRHTALAYALAIAICCSGVEYIVASVPLLLWHSLRRDQTWQLGVPQDAPEPGRLRSAIIEWRSDWDNKRVLQQEDVVALVRDFNSRINKVVTWLNHINHMNPRTIVALAVVLLVVPFNMICAALVTALFIVVPAYENPEVFQQVRRLPALVMFPAQYTPRALSLDGIGACANQLNVVHKVVVDIYGLEGVTLPHPTHKCAVHTHVSLGAHSATTRKTFSSWIWHERVEFHFIPNVTTMVITVYDTASEASDFVGAASIALESVQTDKQISVPLTVERAHIEDESFLNELMADLRNHDARERRKYADLRPMGMASGSGHAAGTISASHIRIRIRLVS
eukprot:PhM_4_TR14/c0_g1_i1/m.38599